MRKSKDWRPEQGDEDFERESDHFLSGIDDGSPRETPLEDLKPRRHGLDYVVPRNLTEVSFGG